MIEDYAITAAAWVIGVGGGGGALWKLLTWWNERRRIDMAERQQIADMRAEITAEVKSDADMWRELYLREVSEHRSTLAKLQDERAINAQVRQTMAREIATLAEQSETTDEGTGDDDGG